MRIDEAIKQRGFRRWYERQLIEGHAYLVTGVLALFAALLAVELIEFRDSLGNLLTTLLAALAAGLVCVLAIRQFSRLLGRAEYLAGQANCPKCKTYARFRLVHAFDAPGAIEGRALKVRCRVCEHEWTMG